MTLPLYVICKIISMKWNYFSLISDAILRHCFDHIVMNGVSSGATVSLSRLFSIVQCHYCPLSSMSLTRILHSRLSLVLFHRGFALIGWYHGVARPALLCHKELVKCPRSGGISSIELCLYGTRELASATPQPWGWTVWRSLSLRVKWFPVFSNSVDMRARCEDQWRCERSQEK